MRTMVVRLVPFQESWPSVGCDGCREVDQRAFLHLSYAILTRRCLCTLRSPTLSIPHCSVCYTTYTTLHQRSVPRSVAYFQRGCGTKFCLMLFATPFSESSADSPLTSVGPCEDTVMSFEGQRSRGPTIQVKNVQGKRVLVPPLSFGWGEQWGR
jgi:hypothetical protein